MADGKDRWLEVGMELLTSGGPSALTLERLCQARGKTKGSFYHHFQGMGGFSQELTSHWRQRHTQDLIEATSSNDPSNSLASLRKLAAQLSLDKEMAFRAWAKQDDAVAQAVLEIDRARVDHLARLLHHLGHPEADARAIAWSEYSMLLGMAQLQGSISEDERRSAFRTLERKLHHDL